ncbi:MAG: preprotein translocase subunit SecG [Gammaproteobacteria bacterium]|jgi:preprotein translocase subunit SecG|nr:preprotein translocase subunit SecG [Gammaproteobacteria bacterium]
MLLHTAILIFHVFLAIGLIVLILIQRGKGAEAGAAFGAGASGTVFGARGSASFLTRATAALATMFFFTSLGLAFLSGQAPVAVSVMEGVAPQGVVEDALPSLQPTQDPMRELPALPEQQLPLDTGEQAQGEKDEDLPVVPKTGE